MNVIRYLSGRGLRCCVLAAAMIGGTVLGGQSAAADTPSLPPHTKLRINVVQWATTKGQYEKWDALGGDFEVSDDGTLVLPVVGKLDLHGLDTEKLSEQIAERLKTRIGLVEKPQATVSIIDYPPIYVVGDVKLPGEYKYRLGLTVLQSLALSGGEYRLEGDAAGSGSDLELASTLRGLGNSILRSEIRIARLQAEMAGAKKIDYKVKPGPDSQTAAAILRQETAIFAARENLIDRQAKSFTELRDFLAEETANLEKKTSGSEADIASVEKELRNVKAMVEKGIALPSRQGDLERMLRSYYAGRLDLATAIMRARQGIADTSRNIEGLYDNKQSSVAAELQTEQANLFLLGVKRDAVQQQLVLRLRNDPSSIGAGQSALSFSISRRTGDAVKELAAAEDTPLRPGDVVRVTKVVAAADEAGRMPPTPSAAEKLSSQ